MIYSNVFEILAMEFKKEGIKALLIGGFAVNSYGVSRQTFDVNFMIAGSDYLKVLEILKGFGFEEYYKQDVFSRLKSPKSDWMDVDFMFVDLETLEPMLAEGKKIKISQQDFIVPSLNHLIALKLHSLRHNQQIREYKDMLDILKLTEQNQIDVKSESFKSLCLKYGTEDLYQKILEKKS